MSSQEATHSSVEVDVTNVGGISETSVGFAPGVTVLTGRNATNRTSFLRAIMAGLGSDSAALKGDAEAGEVDLTLNGETYTRSLARLDGTTVFDGEAYLEDGELADLFAFLLESNDARQAVERGDDLYDVIMRPVDTDEIDAQIDQLEDERQALQASIGELDALKERLPTLEERRTELQAEIEDKEAELAEKRAELDDQEVDEAPTALQDRLEELRETRNELEDVRSDLDEERRLVEALQDDRANFEADLDGLAVADDDEIAELEAEISRLRESVRSIESGLSDLQAVIQFNESLLDEGAPALLESIQEQADGDVTDKLLAEDEELVCWTCGSTVERSEIDRTVDLLREVHSEKHGQRNTLREEIDELEAERKHLERTRDERRRLRRQLDEVETELEERSDRSDRLEAEIDELEGDVAELVAAVEDLESDGHDEFLDLHREVNELEFELDRLEAQLDDVAGEIDGIEERLEERQQLEARREEIDAELDDLRSRIERLETEAVEQFNDQMDTILELLEFENLERIWIERVEREVKEGRRKVTKPAFDLHVIRTAESGTVYEDTVDHLSESERELVGLVFALAGYLVHEVYDQVPFILLDSLEAFDAERLSILVDYLAEYAEYLVVALLPEDAAALDDSYQRVTEI